MPPARKTWKNYSSFYKMTRNRLYLLLAFGLLAGYCWLAWSLWHGIDNNGFTPCLFKNATGIACPSCGSTRSAALVVTGNLKDAFLLNPLGFVVAAVLAVVPFWLLYDVALQKDTLYRSYTGFEKTLKIKWIAILLIVLLAANWGWNIYKGL